MKKDKNLKFFSHMRKHRPKKVSCCVDTLNRYNNTNLPHFCVSNYLT